MSLVTRLTDRGRLAWHIASSLPEFWSSALNRATVELVGPQPGEVVVDLGAGLGPASVEAIGLVGPTGRVIAVDPSPTMRAGLRLRCLTNPDLRAVQIRAGSAERLPVEASSVDALWAVNATHHFEDLDRFTSELTRVLCPGGRAILVEEDLDHPDHTFPGSAGRGDHGPHAIDVEGLVELFRSRGLRQASSTYRVVAGTPTTVITATKRG